jgi:broad specificity phosphatase PhoE
VDARATVIHLLRHGEVVMAETRRFIGHLDVPLSERGARQCAAQAAALAGVPLAAVFSSDLLRARVSGEIIAAPHGLVPEPLPALREMAMGRWDGLTADEIRAREPEAFRDWMTKVGEFPFPEGESVPDLLARAWPAFESIADRYRGRHVAIVAHGGTNRALLCRALGVPLPRLLAFGQDYAALSVLERVPAGWRLRRLNQRAIEMGGLEGPPKPPGRSPRPGGAVPRLGRT